MADWGELPAFTAVHLTEIPALPAAGGSLQWRPIRRHLGIRAFGVNAYVAKNEGDEIVEEHDETGPGSGGAAHEELYIVLTGHARFTVAGEEIDAPAGTLVFVRDPAARRHAVAVSADTSVMALGGPTGEAYRVLPWEYSFAATALGEEGRHSEAVAILREGLTSYPDNGQVLYNLACYESMTGDLDRAVAHLAQAFALDPETRTWANEDTDLDPIRGRPDYPA